jgi:hypothetical protein
MLRLLAAALLGLVALGAAPAAASHVACGDTLTVDTRLDSDLACPGDGLVIAADGVTLDLGGHTITGSGIAFTTGAL